MFFPISSWFPAFLVTLAVEAPIVLAIVGRLDRDYVRLGIVILFANLASHLTVWYVITQLLLIGTVSYVLVAESVAVAGEAMLYWAAIRKLPGSQAIIVAGLANIASFTVGRLVGMVWPDVFG